MNLIISTTYRPTEKMVKRAKEIELKLNYPYIERGKKSLEALKKEYNTTNFLIVGKLKDIIIINGQEIFFHPSLAKLRINALKTGKEKDFMVESMHLEEGNTVLDCTLGLGADAIVASYIVGDSGKVIGLESSPLLSHIVKEGFKNYIDTDENLICTMSRIKVFNIDYEEYLKKLPDKSFDIVYFDPMFRQPVSKSDAIGAVRLITNPNPLRREIIKEAKRVAKKRIVLKERKSSNEFNRLGFSNFYGGKYSSIAYGMIEVDDKC